jgi:hypothetical protein
MLNRTAAWQILSLCIPGNRVSAVPFEGCGWVSSVGLATTVTLTLYATWELEFARLGLVRFTQLSQPLLVLRNSLK